MKKVYIIGGTAGAGFINSVAESLNVEYQNILVVESVEDIPNVAVLPVKNLEIEPIIVNESYAFDSEFRKKKKPKNQEWQNKIKELQRRQIF